MSETILGDYVFYGDESGDSTMKMILPEYPVFVLTFCAFLKHEYITEVVKHIKSFKFAFWGHDMFILHGKKIRRQMEEFHFLQNHSVREHFLNQLASSLEKSPFTIISTAVDKRSFREIDPSRTDLYDLFLEITVRKMYLFLQDKKQEGKTTYLIIESRLPDEDRSLARAFERILERNKELQGRYPLRLIFANKKVNSIGLQVADLVAYPIARHLLGWEEKRLGFEQIVKPRLYLQEEMFLGKEFSILPEKQKTSDFSEV